MQRKQSQNPISVLAGKKKKKERTRNLSYSLLSQNRKEHQGTSLPIEFHSLCSFSHLKPMGMGENRPSHTKTSLDNCLDAQRVPCQLVPVARWWDEQEGRSFQSTARSCGAAGLATKQVHA